jgi:hypothetical protein
MSVGSGAVAAKVPVAGLYRSVGPESAARARPARLASRRPRSNRFSNPYARFGNGSITIRIGRCVQRGDEEGPAPARGRVGADHRCAAVALRLRDCLSHDRVDVRQSPHDWTGRAG